MPGSDHSDSRAVDRHPHLAEPPPPGWVRVDMHSHTHWSGDCTTTPEELAEAVVDAGIDVLCITDHAAVAGAQRLDGALPCRVVVGEEVRTRSGELIGLFLGERIPPLLPARETAERIRGQGGLVYVPHPFDPLRHCLEPAALDELVAHGLIDAMEVLNAKVGLGHLNARAAAYAAEVGVAAGAGSDAHVPAAVGAAYVDMPDFDGPGAFLEALESARPVGHHWDQPRPWRPRIVPSTRDE